MEEPAIHKVRAAANVVRNDVPAVAEVMDQEVPSAADVDMGPELTELSELDETFTGPPRAEKVPNVAALDIGPELRELPKFGEMIAGPPRAEEEEKEHFMTVGCDPDGDEPAGADEEWRYFKNAGDANVQPIKNVEVEVPNRKRSRPMPYFDTEAVPNDEAGLVDDCIVADTTYDKENPVIKEGHTFVDKAEFMEIIRTYAIKNEFQSKIEHSDSERYRERCADLECGWRIYAKKLHGCNTFKVVNLSSLDMHTCSNGNKAREATIDFVDDYYSVQRFKLAYQFQVTPMGDKSQWPKNDPPFEVVPPPLERPAGRPRKQRIKASGEPGKRGPYQCKRCFQFGHIEKGCYATQAELEQELPPPRPKKQKQQRKAKAESLETSSFVVDPKVMSSPGVTTRRMASLSPASPGVTTRRMASLSPASPGVTTRRMASISPGGINRRLIIE
ncbi:hypothetical protein ACQ4PT_008923 [Festuca glaucescens]